MAQIAKAERSHHKLNLPGQLSGMVGFQRLEFFHEALAGETIIDLNNLRKPVDLPIGFTNPSPELLAEARLHFNRSTLLLQSTLSGFLMDRLAYDAGTPMRITLTEPAEAGEVFRGIIDPTLRTGLLVVGSKDIVKTGTLPVGQTDFLAPEPYRVNENSTQQIGFYEVYRDGQLQFRNVGNMAAGEGNYWEPEITAGTGLGTLIRFNDAPTVGEGPANIHIVRRGVAERPTGAMFAEMDALRGTVSKIVDVVSEGLGVPASTFQGMPTALDLAAFADRVAELQRSVYIRDVRPSNSAAPGSLATNAWATRQLNSLEADGATWITLGANRITLQPGKYRVSGSAPAYRCDRHQSRLRNITDNATAIAGTSEHTWSQVSSEATTTRSLLRGTVTITKPTTFEVQTYVWAQGEPSFTQGPDSYNSGESSIWTELEIRKVG